MLAVRGELAESGVANNDSALLIQASDMDSTKCISALTVGGQAMT